MAHKRTAAGGCADPRRVEQARGDKNASSNKNRARRYRKQNKIPFFFALLALRPAPRCEFAEGSPEEGKDCRKRHRGGGSPRENTESGGDRREGGRPQGGGSGACLSEL